jgi:flagellar biosynthesis protein FlhF
MSFRRYIASTVREGLDRVRRELGEDAVILSNKRLGPGRIEIVAAASDSMQSLVEEADRPGGVERQGAATREQPRPSERDQTESFQDFIRRQTPAAPVRPRQEPREASPRVRTSPRAEQPPARAGVAMYHEVANARDVEHASADAFEPASLPAAPAPEVARLVPSSTSSPAVFRQRAGRDGEAPVVAAMTRPASSGVPLASPMRSATPPALPPAPEPTAALPPTREPGAALAPTPAARPLPASAPRPLPASAQPQEALAPPRGDRDDARVMDELRSLRAALSDRIAALESNIALNRASASATTGEVVPPRNSAATRVMTRLLMSGFSPELARRVAAHAPATADITQMDVWLHEVLTGNLRCATAADGLLESQGAIALVGPTGVGKTTTVAKLAARFAVRYGAAQLGLVTLDSYRIAAHEQLRSYGRILGIPMHIAQDGATLRELLSSLQGKRLVLIDTCGLSQRDERMEEMLGTLSAARFNAQPIRRVLLLNAASHSETLDEVARAWRAPDAVGAILTKLDEAARIGGAVDCLLRYRMVLFGLTNGQRVPEDWHPAGARLISHVALKPSTSPFTLGDQEAGALAGQMKGNVHA